MGEAEVFTEAAVGAGFMAGEAAFTEEEDSPAVTLDLMAAVRLAVDSGAASMAAGALAVGALVAEALMAEVFVAEALAGADEAGVGAGDLAGAGRIGAMAGDIRMATTATATRITLILLIPTRPTVIRKTT